MAGRTDSNAIFWSLISWASAIVGALIIGAVVAVLFDETAAGIIFGGVSFMVLAWFLSQHLGPPAETEAVPAASRTDAAPATHASPVPEQAPPAPLDEAAPATARTETGRAADVATTAEAVMGGISERVREAARAAGEAARAALGGAESEASPGRPATEALPPEALPPESARPARLDGPREGGPDDLKKIKGVGPRLEELLHSLGFYHFDQIAAWTPAEIAWVDSNLEGFNGRATRDDWVGQSRTLAAGDETEFSQRVDKGEVY